MLVVWYASLSVLKIKNEIEKVLWTQSSFEDVIAYVQFPTLVTPKSLCSLQTQINLEISTWDVLVLAYPPVMAEMYSQLQAKWCKFSRVVHLRKFLYKKV